MKSFKDFKNLSEATVAKKRLSGEAAAQSELEDALRAQAEASVQRDAEGKEIRKTRRYYLQNNPQVNVLHRIKNDAANAAVMKAQARVTQAQQEAAAAAQAKAAAKAPKPVQEPVEPSPEDSAPMEAPKPVVEPSKPKLSEKDQAKEDKRVEREMKKYRSAINIAQRNGLDGKYN